MKFFILNMEALQQYPNYHPTNNKDYYCLKRSQSFSFIDPNFSIEAFHQQNSSNSHLYYDLSEALYISTQYDSDFVPN